ncbi:lasso RiPP family leader peptide-containing protein [Longimycelium tulufanense]|nr:lasso RiPP family leader peptide-containing protein [Longimycelium tulufanense]
MQEQTAYESPALVEVGTFECDTQGWWGANWDGPSGMRD